MPKVLVAGASGVVGAAALERFLDNGWDAIALSRRRPDIDSPREFDHLSVDLRDPEAARAALSTLSGVSHVVYTALYEKPGLIAGWSDPDQMETNLQMLKNFLEPLVENNDLENVTILQGTKAYGIHLHPMPIPARERAPRDDHANFYWLQEDYLKEQAAAHGFRWNVLRPQLIIGSAIGAAMNLAPVIGAYAAICKEHGEACGFPGGIPYVWEAVDSRLCAAALEMMATNPEADGQHYNVTNGDVFEWRNLWPALMEQMGVEAGPDEPQSMAEFLPANAATWDRIVQERGLKPTRIDDVLGESHYYADFCFAYGAEDPPPPAFVSAIKLRKAGVTDVYDTEETFRHWMGWLQDREVLPRY
ncbi:MAG TPA: SDR family oxidoreductase [Baekduia sp.]|uniref:SDR family oxidoreductase n=1 Tax=Baekduia sp. TaxID=2600305 RepID=UPI002CBF7DBB|nr:SDR family oxidoreductase [Baekduia sp.]HMJ37747.1 SDR family oxidoreductase [Baekduia sp.]